ncbi:S-adenosylmethionine decarboxylase-ornithine decarboxylase-like protein [Plasmodium inui San Antonio 1]|uniref:S-adenosylmethionine decarboxylase-ornithine decarboxylase-like protein n=1 Tax=Plasmodium inui San Antonio 1 TaxID=1237626 RepID=W7A4D8_9APIC|nr:S-adenosylmethionine decarboxylase-ornithine decarboxylase-like protein [Plasmodium inui San Antonio 1]EUD66153.1 S-adenosylmethionine decarboxylase-ornithine decarboxylase-like protein [Plasmodium inui San Antonio 1]
MNVFEGIEKRVVIKLRKECFEKKKKISSLLDISRELWEQKLNLIGCSIVSEIEEDVQAPAEERCRVYLLSESSLFIYTDMVFIKTCGKTKVLFFIPFLVDLLILKLTNEYALKANGMYDESFLSQNDLIDIIEFIGDNFEYAFFTHMNYQNKTKDGYYEQEYPHKSIEDEKTFFQFFFKTFQFANTPLPHGRNHYIFFAQVNQLVSDAANGSTNGTTNGLANGAVHFPPSSHKFCSEMHLFGINKHSERAMFHELYLNEDSLGIFHSGGEPQKVYEENEKTDICCSENSYDYAECSSKSTTNTSCLYKETMAPFRSAEDMGYYGHPRKEAFSNFHLKNTDMSSKNLDETIHEDTVSYRNDEFPLDGSGHNRGSSVGIGCWIADASENAKSLLLPSTSNESKYMQRQIAHESSVSNMQCELQPLDGRTQRDVKVEQKRENNTDSNAYLNEFYPRSESMAKDSEVGGGGAIGMGSGMGVITTSSHCSSNDSSVIHLRDAYSSLNSFSALDNCIRVAGTELSSFPSSPRNSQQVKQMKSPKPQVHVKKIDTNLYECSSLQNNKEKFLYNEFYFTPCGYSCNVSQKNNYFCVHYSPEDLVSYVSIELASDLRSESFFRFMANQLSFYGAKVFYVMNYHYDVEGSSIGSRVGGMSSSPTSEATLLHRKLCNNIIVNNEQYYAILCMKELTMGFLKMQYFVYELKSVNDVSGINLYLPSGRQEAGNNFAVTPLPNHVVNDMYTYSYLFCKQNRVMMVDMGTESESNGGSLHPSNPHRNSDTGSSRNLSEDSLNLNVGGTTQFDGDSKEVKVARLSREALESSSNSADDPKGSSPTSRVDTTQTNEEECPERKHKEEMTDYYRRNKIEMFTLSRILNEDIDTSVVCINLQKILAQYIRFKKNLPSVTPFYSVKSNNDDVVLKFLYGLNANFDCASVGEVKKLTTLLPDLARERIIYANTIKSIPSLIYAKNENINLCTFDNIEELKKILKYHPTCSLLLRINVDFKNYKSYMSSKYGANEHEWENILSFGRKHNLNIIGVSFHVGSNTKNLFDYCQAIKLSRDVWNMSNKLGYHFEILNLGGGYPEELEYDSAKKNEKKKYCTLNEAELKKDIQSFLNDKSVMKTKYNFYNFEKIALAINMSIEHYFKDIKSKLRIICEPGRYMVAASSTLAVKVIGKRHPTFQGIRLRDLRGMNPLDFAKRGAQPVGGGSGGADRTEGNIDEGDRGEGNVDEANIGEGVIGEGVIGGGVIGGGYSDHVSNSQGGKTDRQEGVDGGATHTEGSKNAENAEELLLLSHTNLSENLSCNSNSKLGNITNIKRKVVSINDNRYNYYSYYVSDSIYGCFSGIIFDEYNRSPVFVIRNQGDSSTACDDLVTSPIYLANIFGQSCDGLDMITSITYLPECYINDWIIYEYAGAYTFVSSSNFNGFRKCQKVYIFPNSSFSFLK